MRDGADVVTAGAGVVADGELVLGCAQERLVRPFRLGDRALRRTAVGGEDQRDGS